MSGSDPSRPAEPGVGRQLAEGAELVLRNWVGRFAGFLALLLAVMSVLAADAPAGRRATGVVVGLVIVVAVMVGWWRRAPGAVQWAVGVVGAVVAAVLLVVVVRA